MSNYTFEIKSPKYGVVVVTAPARFRSEIERYTWCVRLKRDRSKGRVFEIQTSYPTAPWKRKHLFLHRLIWSLADRPPTRLIDHEDGNTANNSEDNLRAANHVQNGHNQRSLSKRNTSGVSGVILLKPSNKWSVRLRMGGKRICLGTFATKEAARQARDRAVLEHRGPFAVVSKEMS